MAAKEKPRFRGAFIGAQSLRDLYFLLAI